MCKDFFDKLYISDIAGEADQMKWLLESDRDISIVWVITVDCFFKFLAEIGSSSSWSRRGLVDSALAY